MIQSGNLYADLSGYYDLFCAEVDYAEQCAFAQRAFQCFATTDGKQYLDLACGTGAHIELMQAAGFVATGLDNSPSMLEQTASRCPGVQCLLSDMSMLDMQDSFDLVTCFLYSIHYSYPAANLQQTLQRVFAALKPGGVFIFNSVDINGINSRHIVSTQVNTAETSLAFQSGWTYSGSGDVMELHLSISEQPRDMTNNNAQQRVWRDQHTMTAVNIHDLKQWLQQCGFEVTLLEHDYSRMQPWDGHSFNLIVIASKA